MVEQKILSIRDAFRLYKMLGPYLPKTIDMDKPAIDFIQVLVSNLRSGNPLMYVKSIMLMTNQSMEEVTAFDSDQVLNLFVEGIFRNKILELKIFCDSLGIAV